MTVGELTYLIKINDQTDDGIKKSEGKIKNAEKKLTAFGIARAQMIMDYAKKAASASVNFFKNTVKSAVMSYADYEQLVGGVETLFKGSAQKVQEYASQAYKTVGVSANEYMENVTLFSASLLQSLGGDTDKAADIADMAMQDMADNANKMGTSIDSIQHAYQGFAKQNYTMLDNLKLGYGGTKTEMQRLLKDAEKLTGKKYNLNNLSDVYDAIHAIQVEMDITGTTAKEAEHTISGSINMTKASWKDLLVAIGAGRDVKKATKQFTSSLKTTIKNIIPIAKNAIKGIFEAVREAMPEIREALSELFSGLKKKLPVGNIFSIIENKVKDIQGLFMLVSDLITNFPDTLKVLEESDNPWLEGFGKLVEFADLLITKIRKGTSETGSLLLGTATGIVESISDALQQISDWLAAPGNQEKLTNVIENIVGKFINSFVNLLPKLIDTIVTVLPAIGTALINLITDPGFIKALNDIILSLAKLLPDVISGLTELLVGIVTGVLGNDEFYAALWNVVEQLIRSGYELIKSLMTTIVTEIGDTIEDFGTAAAAAWDLLTGERPVEEMVHAKPGGTHITGTAVEYDPTLAAIYGRLKTRPDADGVRHIGSQREALEGLSDALRMPKYRDELIKIFGDNFQDQVDVLKRRLAKGETTEVWNELEQIREKLELALEDTKVTVTLSEDSEAIIEKELMAMNLSVPVLPRLKSGAEAYYNAKGNWRVPYDNYPALLHRDEIILSKSQARQLRDGYSDGSGISGDALAAAVERAMSRVYVMMSGEKVGDLTTRRIKKNLNAGSYSRMRALGG